MSIIISDVGIQNSQFSDFCFVVLFFFNLFTGRRICLGDKLARMELFIFLSHLLHQFTFKSPSLDEIYPHPGIGKNPQNPLLRVAKRD